MAALDAALAASLLAMVANLTLGRKRYLNVQQEVARIRDAAVGLRDHASTLVRRDSEAYRRVSGALALPKDTDAEKEGRQRALQEALKGAVDPPLETMRTAEQIILLAQDLVGIGNRSAVSDVGAAALIARSAYHAAQLNVEINLAAIRDGDWVSAVRATVRGRVDVDALERQVLGRVHAFIRGAEA